MFDKLKDMIGTFLHQRGIKIENRSPNTGGLVNLYDANLRNHTEVSPGLRNAVLGKGATRKAPDKAVALNPPTREHGRITAKDEHRRYLEDGWLEKD